MKTLTMMAFCFLILLSPAFAQTGTPVPAQDRPSSAAPAKEPAGANVSPDYRLTVGDKLRVEVYKDPQLSQSLQVRPDGKVTLPLIGDVPAAGRTSSELRDAIAASLKDYITTPVVTVIVVETVPPMVYVMGEVNSPGPQPMHGPTSVLQALAMAGGFKDFAHTKSIKILRKTPTGLKTLMFNYNEAVKSSQAPLLLEPGDTVIVP
jgi:polysaccharide export outer membrane protein